MPLGARLAAVLPIVAASLAAYSLCLAGPITTSDAAQPVFEQTLDDLRDDGEIDDAKHDSAIDTYRQARATRNALTGPSRTALGYTIQVAERLAREDRLTGDRVDPIVLIMLRNRNWFAQNGPAVNNSRRRFGTSRIIFQYFSGKGWQIHPLANFSRLNAVWLGMQNGDKFAQRSLAEYARELSGLAVTRGGFTTWEYYFSFGGGQPPWISAISQGTALQALGRVIQSIGGDVDAERIAAQARSAVGAFATPPPTGLRVPSEGGNHYLIYSYAPDLRVLNAFIQSLNGLRDFGIKLNDGPAMKLYDEGEAAARIETPKHDTGAWSLYAQGRNESSLHYHVLLRNFLRELCDRNGVEAYCAARDSFTTYLSADPTIKDVRVTGRTRGRVSARFDLSKISLVSVKVFKGSRQIGIASATVARGKRRFSLRAPRKSGSYRVVVSAVDLAGNKRVVSKPFRLKTRKTRKKTK